MESFHDVACTVCGCVCDDLTLTFDGDRLVGEERACELARPWLYSLNDARPPVARIQGAETTLDEAIVGSRGHSEVEQGSADLWVVPQQHAGPAGGGGSG